MTIHTISNLSDSPENLEDSQSFNYWEIVYKINKIIDTVNQITEKMEELQL